MKDIKKRALEIEKSIIDDTINHENDRGLLSFISFLNSLDMTKDETESLNDFVINALQAPFSDRHKPLNALVCRAVEWQAERLARLEGE